jgi:hypothetical protein
MYKRIPCVEIRMGFSVSSMFCNEKSNFENHLYFLTFASNDLTLKNYDFTPTIHYRYQW